jgi:excisionase family DNA binding protein
MPSRSSRTTAVPGFSGVCNEMHTITHLLEPMRYCYFSWESPCQSARAPARCNSLWHLALGKSIMATQNLPRQGSGFPSVRRLKLTPERAARVRDAYRRYFVNAEPARHLQLVGPDGVAEDIPIEIYAVLREVFQHLKDGQAISLIPDDTLLTTQQAAEILNISRPYLYRLLDADEIPFVRVGTHRKLRLADVEALRERRRNESRKALNAIAALNQECDDYGENYGETTRE